MAAQDSDSDKGAKKRKKQLSAEDLQRLADIKAKKAAALNSWKDTPITTNQPATGSSSSSTAQKASTANDGGAEASTNATSPDEATGPLRASVPIDSGRRNKTAAAQGEEKVAARGEEEQASAARGEEEQASAARGEEEQASAAVADGHSTASTPEPLGRRPHSVLAADKAPKAQPIVTDASATPGPSNTSPGAANRALAAHQTVSPTTPATGGQSAATASSSSRRTQVQLLPGMRRPDFFSASTIHHRGSNAATGLPAEATVALEGIAWWNGRDYQVNATSGHGFVRDEPLPHATSPTYFHEVIQDNATDFLPSTVNEIPIRPGYILEGAWLTRVQRTHHWALHYVPGEPRRSSSSWAGSERSALGQGGRGIGRSDTSMRSAKSTGTGTSAGS